MSEEEIIAEVIKLFPIRQHLCVPNVSWGLFDGLEADLVVMTGSGYLYEIEVKSSVSDLKRDSKKTRYCRNTYRNAFKKKFYAMPEQVWRKIETNPPFPEDAGVIVIEEHDLSYGYLDNRPKIIRKAKVNADAQPLTPNKRYQLARLGTLRYWNRVRSYRDQLKDSRLRRFLWLHHGCEVAALCGAKGEMSCHTCTIDCKRMSIPEILDHVHGLDESYDNTDKIASKLRELDQISDTGCEETILSDSTR